MDSSPGWPLWNLSEEGNPNLVFLFQVDIYEVEINSSSQTFWLLFISFHRLVKDNVSDISKQNFNSMEGETLN